MSAAATFGLRGLPLFARLGLSAAVLASVLGLGAGLLHMRTHHAKNDGDASALTRADLVGAYHGLEIKAPLRAVIGGEARAHPQLDLPPDERVALLAWLSGTRIAEDYDSIDLGESAPAEIVSRRCAECHSQARAESAGGGQALEYWEDLAPLLSDKQIRPTPKDLLVVSLHTHAPVLALLLLVLGGACFLTRAPRGLAALPLGFGGLGLAADLGGWLLARDSAVYVNAVIAGGAAYFGALLLAAAIVLLDLWWPLRRT